MQSNRKLAASVSDDEEQDSPLSDEDLEEEDLEPENGDQVTASEVGTDEEIDLGEDTDLEGSEDDAEEEVNLKEVEEKPKFKGIGFEPDSDDEDETVGESVNEPEKDLPLEEDDISLEGSDVELEEDLEEDLEEEEEQSPSPTSPTDDELEEEDLEEEEEQSPSPAPIVARKPRRTLRPAFIVSTPITSLPPQETKVEQVTGAATTIVSKGKIRPVTKGLIKVIKKDKYAHLAAIDVPSDLYEVDIEDTRPDEPLVLDDYVTQSNTETSQQYNAFLQVMDRLSNVKIENKYIEPQSIIILGRLIRDKLISGTSYSDPINETIDRIVLEMKKQKGQAPPS